MPTILDVVESPVEQGANESIAYTIDTTPYGGSASSPAATISLRGTDVTATNMTGSATVSDDVIQTPSIHSLIAGNRYDVVVTWTASGNTEEARFEIKAV